MQKLLALQLKRINYVLSNLKIAHMEVIQLEDAVYTTAEEETETTCRLLSSIRELKLLQHDINIIRRKFMP